MISHKKSIQRIIIIYFYSYMNESLEQTIKRSQEINKKYQLLQNQMKQFLIQSEKTKVNVDNTLKLVTSTLKQVSQTQSKIVNFQKSFNQAINKIADSTAQQYPNGFSIQSNIQQIYHIINKNSKILILTGAGISALSGIRPFRGEGGLYDDIQDEQQATPEKILTEWYFDFKPSIVWQQMIKFWKEIQNSKPNINHLNIQQLINTWLKLKKKVNLVTLNIDNLHQKAHKQNNFNFKNSQKFKFYEIHGNIYKLRCQICTLRTQTNVLKQFNYSNFINPYQVEKQICQKCKSPLRPHFTFLDQSLTQQVNNWDDLLNFVKKECDMMIIIGTSLKTKCGIKLLKYAIEKNMQTIQINISPQIQYKNNRYIADKAEIVLSKLVQLFQSNSKKNS